MGFRPISMGRTTGPLEHRPHDKPRTGHLLVPVDPELSQLVVVVVVPVVQIHSWSDPGDCDSCVVASARVVVRVDAIPRRGHRRRHRQPAAAARTERRRVESETAFLPVVCDGPLWSFLFGFVILVCGKSPVCVAAASTSASTLTRGRMSEFFFFLTSHYHVQYMPIRFIPHDPPKHGCVDTRILLFGVTTWCRRRRRLSAAVRRRGTRCRAHTTSRNVKGTACVALHPAFRGCVGSYRHHVRGDPLGFPTRRSERCMNPVTRDVSHPAQHGEYTPSFGSMSSTTMYKPAGRRGTRPFQNSR